MQAKRRLKLALKFALRGAVGFGCGSLFIILMEWLFFSRMPQHILPAYYIFLAFFLCGATGAIILLWQIEGAYRAAIGFGFGFVISSFLIMFTMLSLQGSANPEYAWGATGCGIGFALAGGLGGMLLGGRFALAGAFSFGVAGAAWGLLLFFHFWQRKGAVLLSLTDYIGILVILFPYVIGGALFGAFMGYTMVES
jgi:hypothetical protein